MTDLSHVRVLMMATNGFEQDELMLPRQALIDAGAQVTLAALHPLGHIGEPDDIAWGCVYLASDEAKFVTGAELVIDGGYTAR